MTGMAVIDRVRFDLLFHNTLDAIQGSDLGRIFKDVMGTFRGDRAVSVWAEGAGTGLNEISIDTGYTVERNGIMRFSQGEGCLDLAVRFDSENDSCGVVELATNGGVDVPLALVDAHIVRMAKVLDLVLNDELPPASLVPPPTVPFPLWAVDLSDHLAQSMIDPLELAALNPFASMASNRR